MADAALFDPGPAVEKPKLSADQRRTLRAQQMLDRGRHPRTNLPLRPGDETCGTCSHFRRQGHNLRTYFKCDLLAITAGPGTDIRKSWPACTAWEPIHG